MLNAQTIEECVIWACKQEVSAPKPGNVNCYSDAHDMEVNDFLKSAYAIAPVMAQTNGSVGDLILKAIIATRTVVDCNTNLGIVLLFAPLCVAVRECENFEQLPSTLKRVLENLTIDDAEKCYQAIRMAEAGGMGTVENHDITNTPTVTLKHAMKIAEKRDTIARQYLNNYDEIRHIGLSSLTNAIICGESVEWATAFAYLMLLSSLTDTLIIRKQGAAQAKEVTTKALNIINKIKENNLLSDNEDEVISFDDELKKGKVNPGTTADLTAATLLMYSFQRAFSSNRILAP